jgi:hypothetical protein
MDDGWVHPLAKTLPSIVNNLWWNIVMDEWNLDEKSIGTSIATLHIYNTPQKKIDFFYKEWQIMLG